MYRDGAFNIEVVTQPAITCSKLTTETLEHVSHLVLVLLLLTLSR